MGANRHFQTRLASQLVLRVVGKLTQSYVLTGMLLTGKSPATNITGNLRTLYRLLTAHEMLVSLQHT